MDFKIGNNKQNTTAGDTSTTEELNESNEPAEKGGNIKTVFKQIFKCAFLFLAS